MIIVFIRWRKLWLFAFGLLGMFQSRFDIEKWGSCEGNCEIFFVPNEQIVVMNVDLDQERVRKYGENGFKPF